MLSPTAATIRLFLHVLAATVWVGSSVASASVPLAEYFVDAIGADGTGTAMTGPFGSPTASVSATLSTAQLATLSSGNHTIYVHGQDANGWGAVASAVFVLIHSLGRTKLALALGGALGALCSLAALYLGILLRTGH